MSRSALLAVAAGAAFLTLATSAWAETVGACVWSRLSEPIKADYLEAYPDEAETRKVNRAMVRLARYDGAIQVAGRGCTELNPPALWVTRAVASHAVQLASAASLERNAGLSRQQVDAAWRNAPGAARTCARTRAGKRFKLKMPVCKDPKSVGSLVGSLGLTGQNAGQAQRYFLALSESEVVEALIARRQHGAAPKD